MAEFSDLSVSLEQLGFIIIKAREFDVKEGVTEPDPGSNPTDDGQGAVLEDHGDDPVRAELVGFIHAMNEDERADLVALAWLGRGDGELADWDELRAQALQEHNKRTASYLLGMPMLADYLEEGLAQFDESIEDVEAEHL
ncbi:DUF3775 domain-containing protein [Methyloferula stellata]|uniref:DUF3775 domain-containing protein n=1 Tax=Methyloferula stellata TaxID=876270 RepID=UPI00036CB4B4|nr:DUF3775 domain-containing protein [Methyloferula stellata]